MRLELNYQVIIWMRPRTYASVLKSMAVVLVRV